MNGEKLIIIISIILGGAILLATGYFIGIGSAGRGQEAVLNSDNSQKAAKKIIDSKIIKNISASGKVTDIDAPNRTITIADGEDSMNIYVKEDAGITSFILVASAKGGITNSKQVKAGFSDIKTGDQISAIIKILADNRIETDSLIIIPASNSTGN